MEKKRGMRAQGRRGYAPTKKNIVVFQVEMLLEGGGKDVGLLTDEPVDGATSNEREVHRSPRQRKR